MERIIMLSNPKLLDEQTELYSLNKELGEMLCNEFTTPLDVCFIAADPSNFSKTDTFVSKVLKALIANRIKINQYAIVDHRSDSDVALERFNTIFLCGGDNKKQIEYIRSLQLEDKIKDFKGSLIGLSAGAMNISENVFSYPHKYNNFTAEYYEGLGLTDITICPHFDITDEKKVKSLSQYSLEQKFYGLPDESFILIRKDEQPIFFGDCYLLENGQVSQSHSAKNKHHSF